MRSTKTRGADGAVLLRLHERARLVDGRSLNAGLVIEDELSTPFAYEETLSESGPAPDADARIGDVQRQVLDLGRRFFERAARLLDECGD